MSTQKKQKDKEVIDLGWEDWDLPDYPPWSPEQLQRFEVFRKEMKKITKRWIDIGIIKFIK